MVVIDDDSRVRLLLQRAFRPPEFETHAFSTGTAALLQVADIRPDCVVGDIPAPDMDAAELVRAMRAVPGLERVPFIAVSAPRPETWIQAVLAAGADAFLQKPFPLRDLLQKVRNLLERSGPRPPSERSAAVRRRPTSSPAVTSVRVAPVRVVLPAPGPQLQQADGVRRVELRPADAGPGFGRCTRVEARGRSFVVLTEAFAQPKFTVTTVITEKGVPQRRIESALAHPLAREDDRDAVRRQLDLQHDDALRRLDDLVLDDTPRPVAWSDQRREAARHLRSPGPVA